MSGDGVSFSIPGKPVPKKRHRTVRAGDGVRSYSDQQGEVADFRGALRLRYEGGILTGPLQIDFLFIFSRPKSHYGTGRNHLILKKSAPPYHVVKPDKDNLEKFALDCMEGIVFKNDSQVWYGRTKKKYCEHTSLPETQIWIREVGDTE